MATGALNRPSAAASAPDAYVHDDGTSRDTDLRGLARSHGQSAQIEDSALLSGAVALLESRPGAIGLMVTRGGELITLLSRQSIAGFLAKPYTQFLFLHRPISELLQSWSPSVLVCPEGLALSAAIDRALTRPVEHRYEPVVVECEDGLRLLDVHTLLVEQNRVLHSTLASLEEQRAATARAEHEREALHLRLLEASRDAGRAEVATGVLHNVGNVLNSVCVSRAMVSRRLEQSKLPNLVRAIQMVGEHGSDLAGFLTNDPQGRQLPGYLARVAGVLGEERDALLTEVKELGDNLEHIKQVVATQQSYARARAVVQDVRPTDLMDDAVRMNLVSFERHNVKVERCYEDAGTAALDRHKVLQILINLISNAKEATKRTGSAERRIVLRVQRLDGTPTPWVRFTIEDNGIGIAPENLTRIFGHGFTTRKDGHGFGLHSSANFARELGGTLTGESDGIGLGARFVLTLPALPAGERH